MGINAERPKYATHPIAIAASTRSGMDRGITERRANGVTWLGLGAVFIETVSTRVLIDFQSRRKASSVLLACAWGDASR